MLYIIPTPIGNLKDITLRALEILKQVNSIICEDTRRTSILLNHYQIKKPLLVLNDFNETRIYPDLLLRLQKGEDLALVSDAGTPLIADPGFKLVRACLEEGIPVDSLPGPTSVTTALTLSGLPSHHFTFLHYLPEKSKARQDLLKNLLEVKNYLDTTYIIFVSPYKLLRTLSDILEVLGDIEVVLMRELTKIHQEVKKQPVSNFLQEYQKRQPKGEFILLFNLAAD